MLARTDLLSSAIGTTCSLEARNDTARNDEPRIRPIHTRVICALRHSGLRNAGTPFEIASTPVTAAPPDAKARKRMKIVTAPTTGVSPPLATCWGTENGWRWPVDTS